jgi:enoyl-CoA hydratase/carnithine racemase
MNEGIGDTETFREWRTIADSGRRFSGAEAADMRLVNRCCEELSQKRLDHLAEI